MIPQHLLWFDCETTGLDPDKDAILEVAALLVDFSKPFTLTDQAVHAICRFQNWSGISKDVLEMHAKGTLIQECCIATRTSDFAQQDILNLFNPQKRLAVPDLSHQVVLAGSSVHFDLAFIRKHMPDLAKLLHYRTYDVSSVRNFCYSLGMPETPPLDPQPHRAKDDLMASIKLGQYCAEWLQKTSYLGAGR